MKQVFVIHGWTYSLDKWYDVCDYLQKRGIELVLLKVPGLTEPSDKVWDIDGYISWLDSKLQGQTQPIVIGHSNGGRIALSYIQRYPGRISQLILIDSAGIPKSEKKTLFKLKILRVLSKIGKIFSYIPPLKRLFYRVIGAQDYYNAPANMKKTMQNMLHADQLIDLSQIKLPVTIIWGSDDTQTPLADGQKMHTTISRSKLYIVDGARHAPQATHTEKVVDIIAKALEAGK